MFFSGDSSTRKRVDLGGRSSKERDRQKILEQARLERKRRLNSRQQNTAALKIQKCFRGRKAVEAERSKIREQFCLTFGKHCEKVDRNCFNSDSGFLQQLLFFFNAHNSGDFLALVETCRLLHRFVQANGGDVVDLFAGMDYKSKHAIVENRVKRLAFACLQAVHHNRNQLKDQLLLSSACTSVPAVILLEAVVILTEPKLPWVCKVVGYLLQRNTFGLLREIVFTVKQSTTDRAANRELSSLGHVLILIASHVGQQPSGSLNIDPRSSFPIIASHVGQQPCTCTNIDPRWSFSSQVLTIPFLWQLFPHLKEVFTITGMSKHYIHQMALCVHSHANVLPDDLSHEFPGYACLLGNILETAVAALSQPNSSFDMAIDFAVISAFMLEALPRFKSSNRESKGDSSSGVDDMAIDEECVEEGMNWDLEQQIIKAIDPGLLQQLVNVLSRGTSLLSGSPKDGPKNKEVEAVGAICAFLHVTFNTLPLERIMTVLAYRTELVPMLWNFMKWCHENQQWPSLSSLTAHLLGDGPGWLLPLAVFCPVYKHMLMIVDNEEFYEQEKPLSLKDIRVLIVILKQALWQLLWVIPVKSPNAVKSSIVPSGRRRSSVDFIQQRVSIVTSELLGQVHRQYKLQDWNNRQQFTSPSDFHAQEAVDEVFISQALAENTRAYDILKQAPFLVPFTSRVKIFTSQLPAARQRNGPQAVFTRHRFRIRRDRIFEDAFNQLSALSEEDLRGMIRVTFVNELGVEEAGIDGGGIFKDFMENITRAAFDVQYGLFKETADHLLYPNPGSGLIHEQHLQFFHFLGSVLGKSNICGLPLQIWYGHYLYDNGSYEEAMEQFLASSVDITYILSLYPSIVLPRAHSFSEPEKVADFASDALDLYRVSSDASDEMDPSSPSHALENDEKMASKKTSHNALMALIKFLQKKRYSIIERATAEGTEEAVSDAVQERIKSSRSTNTGKSRGHIHISSGAREMAAILDTALLQALLHTGQSSAALDLLKGLNYCDIKICEEFLQERNYYTALLELYKCNEMHREALKLLNQLVEESNSGQMHSEPGQRFRPEMIIEYLKPLCSIDPMLVLEYSMHVLESCPTQTIELFLSGNIPADLVNSYLKQKAPKMQATYLELMLSMNESAVSANLQNELVLVYLSEVLDWYGDLIAQQSWDEKAYSPTRKKLLSTLESMSGYNPEVLLKRLPADALYEEHAILLGKMNQHQLALSLYIHKLHVPELAIAYCDRVHEVGQHHPSSKAYSNIYQILLQIYLNPSSATKEFASQIRNLSSPQHAGSQKIGAAKARVGRVAKKVAEIEGADDLRFNLSSTDSGRSDVDGDEPNQEGGPIMLDEALDLLNRRWDRINGAQALKLLPKETTLQNLQSFLEPLLKKSSKLHRNFSVIKSLRHGENLQVKEELYQQRRTVVKITSDSICALCNKRIGSSVFAVYPNGKTLVHFVCFRDSQSIKAVRRSPLQKSG